MSQCKIVLFVVGGGVAEYPVPWLPLICVLWLELLKSRYFHIVSVLQDEIRDYGGMVADLVRTGRIDLGECVKFRQFQ